MLENIGRRATIITTKLRGNFGALRDSSPDAWGRKLIEKRLGNVEPTEIQHLLNSPDDRAGALGFGLNVEPPSPVRKFNRTLDLAKLANAGAAILGAGRPILVVPPAVKSLQAEHVAIGWKDTREARRAVLNALPFLHEAKRVTVIEICENDQMDAALLRLDDVVHYLARHMIKAEGRAEMQLRGSGADQMMELAEGEDADLLVTGAYGHSRLSEWIFGGMTRDLLSSSPICCLMSH
jgi:nucleotide-binding universal stress UspA family protein